MEESENIVGIVEFGLENIAEGETVEVNLRDLMYVHGLLSELMRFFHQREHYPELADVQRFLGSVDNAGAFAALHTAIYERMRGMIPEKLDALFDEGAFDSPARPFYFEPKEPAD